MCICVRLQDPDEKPTKADPKYFEKACVALLKKVESGQVVTRRMLQQEEQKFYRQDYKAWHKRVRAKKVRANDDIALLTWGHIAIVKRSSRRWAADSTRSGGGGMCPPG